ncbi:hypothetical protein [Sporomusa sp. KB1]|uniref:hypothetical protein n=1 Tax=Sporomusa sp. KB1 TaxID=943346 RepID=UPI0011A91A06|nr:hypothetical protein [Sporomusa sp. KB1]TWH48404.1 hypothetical protein Salpa_4556 [Sporomusa sp. KB1]
MTETDIFIKEKVVPFREKILSIVKEKHPYLYSVADSLLAGRKNKVGLQVTRDGEVIGEYTFHLEGLRVESVDTGQLDSGIHHPLLGLVKPYGVIEINAIERIVNDEELTTELISAFARYLPDITVKFLR